VHRDSCERIQGIDQLSDQLIAVQWSKTIEGEFKVELRVEVLNNRGILALLTNTFAERDASVENIHIDARDSRHTIITFLISVQDRHHLNRVIKNLRSIEAVTRVSRGP
jgi:guanosine-3',5'-bis(diphosphate) 3'-pyrophosphohydrolase